MPEVSLRSCGGVAFSETDWADIDVSLEHSLSAGSRNAQKHIFKEVLTIKLVVVYGTAH